MTITPYRTSSNPGPHPEIDGETKARDALGTCIGVLTGLDDDHDRERILRTLAEWFEIDLSDRDDDDDGNKGGESE
jgi:hypothetical protein